MADLAGFNYINDINISGLSNINADSITVTDLSATNLTVPRVSTAAVKAAIGSTVNVTQIVQNLEFDTASPRHFRIYDDTGFSMMSFDLVSSSLSYDCLGLGIFSSTFTNSATNTNFTNTATTFLNSNITLNNSNVIANSTTISPVEISYLDNVTSNIQTQLNARGVLAATNDWAEQNTFRKGLLPCRGTGTNPESDIQLGGNNQLQFRQAASANNISIGQLTLQGSSVTPANNTGSRNIGISHNALQNLTNGTDNVFIGYQAGQNCFGGITQNVAIGNYAMQQCVATSGSVVVGYNSGRNVAASNNVIIGANSGNGITTTGGSVIIGSGHSPTSQDNSVVILGQECAALATGNCLNATILIGYRCGYKLTGSSSYRNVFIGYECGFNSTTGVAACFFMGFNTGYDNTTGSYNTGIGYEALRFNTTGAANCGYGTQALYFNKTGSNNTAVGTQAGVHTAIDLNYTSCIGVASKAQISNECVLGGETATDQVFLTLPNKHRIACNQSPTGATINLTFRSNENIFITDNATNTINLPAATGTFNIGAKFNLYRQASTVNTILINAPAGQSYAIATGYGAFFNAVVAPYSWLPAERYLSVICINSTGTSWLIQSSGPETVTYLPATSTLQVARSTDYVGIPGTITYKKYYVSMVNPTEITATATTLATPLYEYTKVNFAGGTITLPTSASVEIGTILRFRKTGNLGSAITVTPNTSQVIYGYNSATTVNVAVDIMPANITYGSVLYITTNVWAVLDRS